MEPIKFADEDERVICKSCGEPFYISPSEQLRWKENGLQLPKRCSLCRRQGRHAALPADKSNFDDVGFARAMANARNEIAKWK